MRPHLNHFALRHAVLLTIDTSKVEAEVRTENGSPHIYGPLPIEAARIEAGCCGSTRASTRRTDAW